MDENSFDFGNDNQLLEEMIRKRHKGNTGLAESIAAKRESEKNALRNIKGKIGLAFGGDAPSGSAKKPLTEAEIPILDFVSAVKKTTASGPVNSESEPVSLNWSPIGFEELKALNPPNKAISDLRIMVAGAIQQPGTSFALVGPGDERGGYFVKADGKGNLFYASASKNPKAFTNPGTNSDGDKDADDKGRTITPDTSPEAFMNVLNVIKDKVNCLETEINALKTQSLTERKIDWNTQMEGMDDKSKAVINRLLSMAKEIREGGKFPEKFDLPNNVTPSSTPAKSNSLMEALTADVLKELEGLQAAGIITRPKAGGPASHPDVGRGGESSVGVGKAHDSLVAAQKNVAAGLHPLHGTSDQEATQPVEDSIVDLSTKMLRKLSEMKKTKEVESVITSLTDIIAENLLTENVNVKAFNEAVAKYNKLVG